MSLDEDFIAHVAQHVHEQLAQAGYDLPEKTGHPYKDAHKLLMSYWGLRRRTIEPQPRTVSRSRELHARELHLDPKHRAALDAIERASVAGDNLNPRLSRTLKRLDFNDSLLNDWGLHHFHLGTELESDGFVERDGPLLFGLVKPDALYLIDVRDHGAWCDEDLVEIIHQNWRHLITHCCPPGVVGLASALPTRTERAGLRKAGIETPFQTNDGTVYILMGGGTVTSGASLEAVRWGDYILRTVRNIAQRFEASSESLRHTIENRCGLRPAILSLRLCWGPDGFAVLEEASQIIFPVTIEVLP